MPSWQARFFSSAIRTVLRRRNWGAGEELARRARRAFGAPRPYGWYAMRGLRREHVRDGAVRGEWLGVPAPQSGVILYIHGGGFVACSPATHRPISAALARLTQRRIFSVDYRLAPEHPFPAAQDDALAAFDWLVREGATPGEIVLVGDSAGGNLVLSLAIALRDRGHALPACVVAFSPWTDLAGTGASLRKNDGRCAMFRTENIADFAKVVLGATPPTNPVASPAYAALDNLPPVLVHVGSTELLLDDARRTVTGIQAAGGVGELQVFDDVPHCWQMLFGLVPEATRSLREAAAFARLHWPPPAGVTRAASR